MADQAYVIVHVPEDLALPTDVADALDALVAALDQEQEVEGFASKGAPLPKSFIWGGDGPSQWVRPLSTDLTAQIDGIVAERGTGGG